MSRIEPGYAPWRGQILRELTKARLAAAKLDLAAAKKDNARAEQNNEMSGNKVKTTLATSSRTAMAEAKLKKALADEKFLAVYIAYHQSVLFGKDTSQ